MGVALGVRHRGDGGVVAHRTVGIDDIAHGRHCRIRDHDALERVVLHYHVHDPAAVLLFVAVGLDRDAGLQRAGNVLIAVDRLEHRRVQGFQQGVGEGVRLFGLLGQHGITAPCRGVLAAGRVRVGQAVTGNVAQRFKGFVQFGLCIRGQRGAQRCAPDGTAHLGLCGAYIFCIHRDTSFRQ